MRLWHKDLIPYLPRQQLIGQWRECCLIARSVNEKGTPNHMLVNKVVEYPISHFIWYTKMVYNEMKRRGYEPDWHRFQDKFTSGFKCFPVRNDLLFSRWHNVRYLQQCLCNLQEKYDCGGISHEEWKLVMDKYKSEAYLYTETQRRTE